MRQPSADGVAPGATLRAPATDPAKGLSSAEAELRLKRDGRNEVPDEPRHPVRRFLGKFSGPSAWMIEAVAGLSMLLHRGADALLGAALLAINAVLSTLQEQRASAAVDALRSRLRVSARVLRDGTWKLVPATEVVPGDVLRVRSGDFVPADARLVSGEIRVDESALTGESGEVAKARDAVARSGTVVRRGEATAVVVATGTATSYGRTTHLVQSARPRLHVEEVVAGVVRWLFLVTGGLTGLALAVAVARRFPVVEVLPLLLLLLLSAVPVALPVMFTVSMAVGAMELSRRGVLVTRLSAAEDAATMDVLCADKTGTITLNRLSLVGALPRDPFAEEDVVRFGAMASEEADQDPIDVAFVAAARARGIPPPPSPRREFVPFSAETRRTEAAFGDGPERLRVAKGALRTVAELCGLAPDAIEALEARAAPESARGRRALAVARSRGDGPMELVGLALLQDPPRPDSRELVAELRALGVEVKMLTGDAQPVAQEVAREVGLGDVARASAVRDALRAGATAALGSTAGLAEIYPEDKHAVVEALQRAGHVVGMTGDGVNDAPALRQAEVGVAVSGATDVAKGSASVVLTTEGLLGIVQLVRNGRVVYQRVLTWIVNKVSRTVQKSGYVTIAFLLTGRFVISTFGMILLLFMTDFVKVSLATDRMQGSQRPETWRIRPWIRVAVVLGVLMLVENLAVLAAGWRLFDLGGDAARLSTFSFQSLLYFALFSVLSVRERRAFWRSAPSRVLSLAIGADALLGFLLPFADIPGLPPLPIAQTGAVVGAAAVASLLVNDAVKVVLVRRLGLAPASV